MRLLFVALIAIATVVAEDEDYYSAIDSTDMSEQKSTESSTHASQNLKRIIVDGDTVSETLSFREVDDPKKPEETTATEKKPVLIDGDAGVKPQPKKPEFVPKVDKPSKKDKDESIFNDLFAGIMSDFGAAFGDAIGEVGEQVNGRKASHIKTSPISHPRAAAVPTSAEIREFFESK